MAASYTHETPPADPPADDETPRRVMRTPRRDAWTKSLMAAFLRELTASQSVAQAARSVGKSRQSAYRLRARLKNTPFDLGWETALEAGLSQLAHAMLDRAINGVEVPHYYHGQRIGSHRVYDERLAIWIAENPWRIGRHQIAREYSAEGWDRLLDRIEHGPLEWEDGEPVPGRDPVEPETAERTETQFLLRSWYADRAQAGPPATAPGYPPRGHRR
ncbi:hypothetical protein [Croceicoccus hydrothermalis]|uniref:hypothetical protein n=1 Tax=Croceicoccus hydrothermalis TaxID=2867964 RepID=UPI001EFBAD40|nr:hypothetical protein [Croceicoccus hydrothermalis]